MRNGSPTKFVWDSLKDSNNRDLVDTLDAQLDSGSLRDVIVEDIFQARNDLYSISHRYANHVDGVDCRSVHRYLDEERFIAPARSVVSSWMRYMKYRDRFSSLSEDKQKPVPENDMKERFDASVRLHLTKQQALERICYVVGAIQENRRIDWSSMVTQPFRKLRGISTEAIAAVLTIVDWRFALAGVMGTGANYGLEVRKTLTSDAEVMCQLRPMLEKAEEVLGQVSKDMFVLQGQEHITREPLEEDLPPLTNEKIS